MKDVLDEAAGLEEGSPLWRLRRERQELVRLSQTSHDAALSPKDSGNISRGERAALACRMAHIARDAELAAHYADLLAGAGLPELEAVAQPGGTSADPRLAAMVRHVDLVTATPEGATRADMEHLRSVGLTERDIVTLSGLIAFVNYQVRVAAGLRMLRGK